ncbi:hypothetical protein MAUB1S_00507 [Mycolicibacterium aubagnense]
MRIRLRCRSRGCTTSIPVDDVAAFQAELIAKEHGYSRPGIEADGPGGPTMTIIDPSENELRFA